MLNHQHRFQAGQSWSGVSGLRSVMLVLVLLLVGFQPSAEGAPPLSEQADQWRTVLSEAQTELASDFPTRRPERLIAQLRQLELEARAVRRSAKAELETQQAMLDRLRPDDAEKPERNEPPPERYRAIQELVSELEASIAEHSARHRLSAITETRAAELVDNIASWEQQRFRLRMTQPMPSPMSVDVWQQAASHGLQFAGEILQAPRVWWQERRNQGQATLAVVYFVLLPLFGFLLSKMLLRPVLKRYGRDQADPSPGYARRIGAAVADGTAKAIIPVAMVGLAILALTLQGLLTGLFARIVYVLALAVAAYLMLSGLARAALSPHQVNWRIVPVDPTRVSTLLSAIRLAGMVMAMSIALIWLLVITGWDTPALESVLLFITTLLVAVTAGWALSPRYWIKSLRASRQAGPEDLAVANADLNEPGQGEEHSVPKTGSVLNVLRKLLRLALFTAPLIALAGYSRLAYFAQSRLIVTLLILGFGILLHLAVRELIQQFFQRQQNYRSIASEGDPQPPVGANQQGIIFWIAMMADGLIVITLLYALLLLYGVPPTTLLIWTQGVFSGVDIGNFTLAPGNLLIAVLVLSGGLILTSLLRRWLSRHVLPNTRLEYGARNSLAAGFSYLGVAISLIIAMAALGLDFTNLALVVGALSLGMGFGLRNVVENFVAGVLLLIERPVKVGDWILVGEHEGTVKRISVRSTEIETFDRSAVIIPNADLIASAVTNWTHKNRLARVTVKVCVAYGTPTEQVAQQLLDCAREQPGVLQIPHPMALFMALGSSGMDFELRCFVGDTDDYMLVFSELHFSIERSFRHAGIKIPCPRREISFPSPPPSDSYPPT